MIDRVSNGDETREDLICTIRIPLMYQYSLLPFTWIRRFFTGRKMTEVPSWLHEYAGPTNKRDKKPRI